MAEFGRRSQSQTPRHDFPSFQSSHRTSIGGTNPAATLPPAPALHSSTAQNIGQPPPYSSASLGHNLRSHSLDHRRFPAFFGADQSSHAMGGGRAFYTSHAGGFGQQQGSRAAYGHRYTGELFGGNGSRVEAARMERGGGLGGEEAHFRSSSMDKSGVTVVPIRREATLPARRFQSEWKSDWKSGFGAASPFMGGALGAPSLLQQQIAEQQKKEEQAKEEYQFERSSKFSQNRQAWTKPRENFYDRWHRTEMIEAPKSGFYPSDSTEDYSTFRRGQQVGTDAAEAAAQQKQQHTRTQQHERQYREWHSGGGRHHRSAATGAEHYGTLGTRRSGGERHAHRSAATTGPVYQQQQHHYREYGGGGGGGAGAAHRYQNYRQEQQHYANGYGGGAGAHHQQQQQQHYQHQQHMRRSASGGGGGGFFGTGRKSKSSKSSGARWSTQRASADQRGPKRYRKIRLCCFNIIWPPWAVEPSGPPRPLYGRSKASGSPTAVPLEYRGYYPSEGPVPAPPPPATEPQTQHLQAVPNDVVMGGYPRERPHAEPLEYRGPPPSGREREYRAGPGMDVPDYRGPSERAPPGPDYRGPPPQQQQAVHDEFAPHSLQHQRELPVRHEPPPSQAQQGQPWTGPRRD